MPRRVYTYQGHEGWIWLNLLSSMGGFIMTIGFGLVVIDLLAQLRYGRRVRRDPWGAATLEWAMPIPPAPYAFASILHITTRADRIASGELAPSLARGEGYLGFARNGWQETLGVHMTSGAPEQLIVLSRPSYLPLCTALATAAAVLAMLRRLPAGAGHYASHRRPFLARWAGFGSPRLRSNARGHGVSCRPIPRSAAPP